MSEIREPERAGPSNVDRHSSGDPAAGRSDHSGTDATGSERQDRFLTACLVLATMVLVGQWFWLNLQRPEPFPWKRGASFAQYFRVDINNADWVEWIQLQGIGETMAHRIVADREVNGPFPSVDDLQRVHGIGPATLDQIRPWLTIGHDITTGPDSIDTAEPAQQQGSL